MKNLHIIATDKPSRLYLEYGDGDLCLANQLLPQTNRSNNQHIYVTSDEEIKEGDWFIFDNDIIQVKGEFHLKYIIKHGYKKIILTTDQDLIKDGVQSIDDDFLEWFVNNPSCEEIETIIVSTWCNDGKVCVCNVPKFCNDKRNDFKYKIIIPNDESKQETHICKYCKAETTQSDDECYAKPKQDPLEEVAERLLANNIDGLMDALKDDDLFYFYKGVIQSYGEAMAKYQSERMYSKKDMEDSFVACWKANVPEGIECKLSFKEWFEQLKKK